MEPLAIQPPRAKPENPKAHTAKDSARGAPKPLNPKTTLKPLKPLKPLKTLNPKKL